MSEILLKDGVRYRLHKYSYESELEKMVREQYKEIFGENVLFFDKLKMQTQAGIKAETDGFIISPDENRWYILEVELSEHDLYNHIVPQITKFNQAYKSSDTRRRIVKVFYDDINSSPEKKDIIQSKGIKEIHKFLTELVDTRPTIVIPIDTKTKVIEDVCEVLRFENKTIEFKTFERENAPGVYIYKFEPLVKVKPKVKEAIVRVVPEIEERKKLPKASEIKDILKKSLHETREIFEEIREYILGLGPSIIEERTPNVIMYRKGHDRIVFASIKPQQKNVRINLHKMVDDPQKRVTPSKRYPYFWVDKRNDSYAKGLIKQAFEKYGDKPRRGGG